MNKNTNRRSPRTPHGASLTGAFQNCVERQQAIHQCIEKAIWAFRNPRINTKRLEALRLRYWQLEDMSCDIAGDMSEIEAERVNAAAHERSYAL